MTASKIYQCTKHLILLGSLSISTSLFAQNLPVTEFYCTDAVAVAMACQLPDPIEMSQFDLIDRAHKAYGMSQAQPILDNDYSFTRLFFSGIDYHSGIRELHDREHLKLSHGHAPYLPQLNLSSFDFTREKTFRQESQGYRLPYENNLFRTGFEDQSLPPCYVLNAQGHYLPGRLQETEAQSELETLPESAMYQAAQILVPQCTQKKHKLNELITELDRLYRVYKDRCEHVGGQFLTPSIAPLINRSFGAYQKVSPQNRPYFIGVMAKWIDPKKEHYRCILNPRA